MKFTFSKTALIEFQSLLPAQRRTLIPKLQQLAETGQINLIPHLKRLTRDNKFVLRSGSLRVFCHFDQNKNLVVTSIINKKSLQYIYE